MRSLIRSATFWRSEADRDRARANLPFTNKAVPFAGRIGANQEFALEKDNAAQAGVLEKFPDAAPWISIRDSLDLRGLWQVELWKAAVIEGIGMCIFVYLTVFVSVGLGQLAGTFPSGPLIPALIGSLTTLISLPLFIFATGPVSGAHLNPTITIATFFARLATLPRAILYIAFQCFGAAMGGFLLRASFDSRSFTVPGCTMDTSRITTRSAFTIELITDFGMIFLAFGIGLDPRQRAVFGPALGPILVGFVVAMCTFFTGVGRGGYTGISGNPARCFGAMVASRFESYHWIHWIGPLGASIVHGVLYLLLPPYSRESVVEGQSVL
ncbi:aquaporin-like protein [Aspergillus undulatus]|uniref:aquaporin-like protein n=1 Tax=Aspergillus undulatus TaxID=1810928 RepID=UPI003CCE3465